MYKSNILFLFVFNFVLLHLFSFGAANAQLKRAESDRMTMGLGLGFDYGGMGANITGYPQKNIGLFVGLGYTPVGLGYNVGVKARLLSNERKPSVSPFVTGMYGYFAAVKVRGGMASLSKRFYGYTFGAGLDMPIKPNKLGYWSFAILIPLRGNQVDDYVTNNRIILDAKLPPFGISIGYKIMMYRN